jgi:hypothetical protein
MQQQQPRLFTQLSVISRSPSLGRERGHFGTDLS